MRKIFLTGGTGFIGSNLAVALLKRGNEVYFLARSDTRNCAEDRMKKALSLIVPDFPENNIRLIEGGITALSDLSISGIDAVYHCASSLSFKDEDRLETFAVNVGGMKNVLEFMARNHIFELYDLSTAYVCGKWSGTVKEGDLGVKFNNPYEESKAECEKLAWDWVNKTKHAFRLCVFRPSSIVGDSYTGFTPTFNGYYALARPFSMLRRMIEIDLKKNPERYDGSGIVCKRGALHLPITFPGSSNTPINIVPIDIVIEAVMKISEESTLSGTFHVTNSNSLSLQHLVDWSFAFLGIRGHQIAVMAPENGHPIIQEINANILRLIKHYAPYVQYGVNGPLFDQTNTAKVLGQPISFEVKKDFVATLLGYAEEVHYKG